MTAHNFKDLTGQTFNRLTVIRRVENGKNRYARWECKCFCGNIVVVKSIHLWSNHTKSCGCLKQEAIGIRSTTHGMYKTPEYKSWVHMIDRCNNQKNDSFKYYGGRGITVCKEWENSFAIFFSHIGKRPSIKYSIERINNNKGYFPGNCKWATAKKQSNNRSNNKHITLHGWTLNISAWSRFTGISISTIFGRFERGWPPAKAIFKKVTHTLNF